MKTDTKSKLKKFKFLCDMVTVEYEISFYNQAKEYKKTNGLINEWRE